MAVCDVGASQETAKRSGDAGRAYVFSMTPVPEFPSFVLILAVATSMVTPIALDTRIWLSKPKAGRAPQFERGDSTPSYGAAARFGCRETREAGRIAPTANIIMPATKTITPMDA